MLWCNEEICDSRSSYKYVEYVVSEIKIVFYLYNLTKLWCPLRQIYIAGKTGYTAFLNKVSLATNFKENLRTRNGVK